MEYVIGLFVVVLALIIIGYFFKKKKYTDIDRLEEWKVKVVNRPVLEELSKVKQLNMTGETEEMFEKWRNEWDEVITIELPGVEELLFDAEECIDKYRFSKSKEIQRNISDRLKEIDRKIQHIIDELNDLVGSEEKNRIEMEDLKESYRVAKKQLLAHRHAYGKAAHHLEQQLEEIVGIFSLFEEATENGNYLYARELVLKIKSYMKAFEDKMQCIPDLFVECQSYLPGELTDLRNGYLEMVESGYVLDHIDFASQMENIEKTLQEYVASIEKAEIDVVQKGLDDVKEQINHLYDLFEKEAASKQYIFTNKDRIYDKLSEVTFNNNKLKVDLIAVQGSYHLSEADSKLQKRFEKQISAISKQFEQIQAKMDENSLGASIIADGMKDLEKSLESVKSEQDTFIQKLSDLRKDEIEAKESLKDLRLKLNQSVKWLNKHNVPGVPAHIKGYLEETKEAIEDVELKLDETPLDMASVNIFLEKAVSMVDQYVETVRELIQTMLLAEKVIQYTNRYRSRNSGVQSALMSAENDFRNFEYEAALESAAAVLEKVEPGSIKEMKIHLEFEE